MGGHRSALDAWKCTGLRAESQLWTPAPGSRGGRNCQRSLVAHQLVMAIGRKRLRNIFADFFIVHYPLLYIGLSMLRNYDMDLYMVVVVGIFMYFFACARFLLFHKFLKR